MRNSNSQPRSGTQAIERALLVLEEVARGGVRGMRMTDLCKKLPMERPTLHRIVSHLHTTSMLERDDRTKRYFLGRAAYRLGMVAAARFDVREICRTSLTRIASETGDTVFLAKRTNSDGIVIDTRNGTHDVRSNPLQVGMARPLGVGASGLAILSAMSDREIDAYIGSNSARLRQHNVRAEKLPGQIIRSRKNGYAFSRGYGPPRISGIGISLTNANDIPIGAISVITLAERMTPDHRRHVLSVMQDALAPVRLRLRSLIDQ